METKKYIPINCNLYDQLEAYAVKRTPVEIDYLTEDGSTKTRSVIFVNFKIENDGEYGFLQSNGEELKIRLDRILTIDGNNLKDEFGESCAIKA